MGAYTGGILIWKISDELMYLCVFYLVYLPGSRELFWEKYCLSLLKSVSNVCVAWRNLHATTSVGITNLGCRNTDGHQMVETGCREVVLYCHLLVICCFASQFFWTSIVQNSDKIKRKARRIGLLDFFTQCLNGHRLLNTLFILIIHSWIVLSLPLFYSCSHTYI